MKTKLEELKRAIELETNDCRRAILIRLYNSLMMKYNRRAERAGAKLKVESQKQTQKDE